MRCKSDSEEDSEEEGPDLEDGASEDGSENTEEPSEISDDDDENEASARPYTALIKSLTEDSGPPSAKRRKLEHQAASSEKPNDKLDQSEDAPVEDVDHVEEAEQAPDEADAEGAFDEEDDEDEKADPSDPFENHFSIIDSVSIAKRLKAIEDSAWSTRKIAGQGIRTLLNVPDTGDENDRITVPPPVSGPSDLSLKHRLQESLAGKKSSFDSLEQNLAPYMFGYQDLHFCNRTHSNGKTLRQLTCLHALNHVFK